MLPPAEMLSQVDIQNYFNIFRQELRDKYPHKITMSLTLAKSRNRNYYKIMIPAFLLLIWAYLSLVSTIHIFLANTLFYEYLNLFLLTGLSFFCNDGQGESEQDSY